MGECVENKIPLPTDNIYKFYALFGLLLLVFTIGAALYVNRTTNDLLFDKIVARELLRQDPVPTHEQKLRLLVTDRQIEIATSDKTFFQLGLGILGAIGGCCIVYGFRKWHTEVQPILDETAKVQLEVAKLQLAKLRSEAKTTDAKPLGQADPLRQLSSNVE